MNTEYRIEPAGDQFIAIDPNGDKVNTYATVDAAKEGIERCKRDDAMWETASHW
jgi:hypothetical protein